MVFECRLQITALICPPFLVECIVRNIFCPLLGSSCRTITIVWCPSSPLILSISKWFSLFVRNVPTHFCTLSTCHISSLFTSACAFRIPGQLNDRRTMLGELNWIFTAITDTIAWNTLPRGKKLLSLLCIRYVGSCRKVHI